MHKEEFPTFLNEQPKIIFGRTGRELLLIVLGVAAAYAFWQGLSGLLPDGWWQPFCLLISALLLIASAIFASIHVGNRSLEEWAAAWISYVLTPKVYLYQQLDDEAAGTEQQQVAEQQQQEPEHTIFEQ